MNAEAIDTAGTSDPERFVEALRRFDEANAADPNKVLFEGSARPRELIYAQRLFDWVLRLQPEASEALRLAARSQHIRRWSIPRRDYPMDRAGYLRWRNELKTFHARTAAEILRELGYPPEMIERVQALNLKKDFPKDPEACVLEDALCLVFLEHQFAELASRTAEDKMINALRKTWNKMTPSAHARALQLSFAPRERDLLQRALAET